ncbi:MAG: hypothetical protein ABIN24_03195, partial [Dyadobacter sp.]
IHQYSAAEDHDQVFFNHYTFPEYFSKVKIATWEKQIESQLIDSQAVFKTNLIDDKSLYGKYIYPVLSIEIDHLSTGVPRKNVYLFLTDPTKTDRPYIIALRVNDNNWLRNVVKTELVPRSFSTIISQKMPQGFYNAALCWLENDVPKSLLIMKDFAVKKN